MATPAASPLTGDVRLREVTAADLPIFFDQQQEPEANRMAAFPARDRPAFMEHWLKILGDATKIKQTILFDGRVAGNIVSWEQAGEQEVGYWIGRPYWGKGIATGALRAFLHHFPLRPLYAHVAKHNRASVRVLEKCGFTLASEDVEEVILKLEA